MPKAKPTPKTTPAPSVPYTPPEPAFTVCDCGATILRAVWVHGTADAAPHWRTLPEVRTPMGEEHRCATILDTRDT